ncbi:MAG TPA: PH domain-containing protein, partial [Coxiellaceae bacterium]|nr:PH domain-containing protein [Coxiellaceae bacterium]
VMIKIGWIQRNSLEIMLEKVEGVFVDQSVAGRVIGYGAITIIGTGGTKDRFPFIPDPLTFRRAVQQQIDLEDHPEDAKISDATSLIKNPPGSRFAFPTPFFKVGDFINRLCATFPVFLSLILALKIQVIVF